MKGEGEELSEGQTSITETSEREELVSKKLLNQPDPPRSLLS